MEDQPMLDDSRCSNRDSFVIDIQREGSSISHPSSSRCVCKTLCTKVDEIRFSKLHLHNFTNKPTTTTCTSFIVWVRRKSNDYYFVSDIDGSLVVKRYGRIGFPIRNMWLWSIIHGVIFLQRSNSRYLASLAMGKYAQVLELDPNKTGCLSWIRQLADLVMENGPYVLGIPTEIRNKLLLNLNEASLAMDAPEDWEGAAPDQLLDQLASAWGIDLQHFEK
ncbi:hypothetical protein GIB67_017756 [Kingdonia uniflora]|uniref:TORTIFOLIA1/TORL1-2 C-terminal domain-containing protein n=1 Tax=Kingdonia uniflora TaxID=39325 RepID=A0A7J7LQ33_9MAGN|nr:hypothetical protein GIB67_017756 [Kingdonia uniflora]